MMARRDPAAIETARQWRAIGKTAIRTAGDAADRADALAADAVGVTDADLAAALAAQIDTLATVALVQRPFAVAAAAHADISSDRQTPEKVGEYIARAEAARERVCAPRPLPQPDTLDPKNTIMVRCP